MTENKHPDQRLAWTTPELRRIDAGSAEATNKGLLTDGAIKGNNKS